MPSPFSGPKMYCACPKFLSQPKNLTAFSSPVHVVFGQSLGRPIVRSFSQFFWLAQKFWTGTIHFGT